MSFLYGLHLMWSYPFKLHPVWLHPACEDHVDHVQPPRLQCAFVPYFRRLSFHTRFR